jgi:hypothetical protein
MQLLPKGLTFIGICLGGLLIFVHESHAIFVSFGVCSHSINSFGHFDIHPVSHIVIELIAAELVGPMSFAIASSPCNRLTQAASFRGYRDL